MSNNFNPIDFLVARSSDQCQFTKDLIERERKEGASNERLMELNHRFYHFYSEMNKCLDRYFKLYQNNQNEQQNERQCRI